MHIPPDGKRINALSMSGGHLPWRTVRTPRRETCRQILYLHQFAFD